MVQVQYIGQESTTISLDGTGKNKVKVSHGEIIDVDTAVKGLTLGRLFLAGFVPVEGETKKSVETNKEAKKTSKK